MSQEMEMTLRKSLDEVDRTRRRQMVAAGIFLLLFLLQTVNVIHAAAISQFRLTLLGNVALMVYTVGFCTFGICYFITRMTLKILKAIELSSKG